MNTIYLKIIHQLLDHIEQTQAEVIEEASLVAAETIEHDGLLYFFGTGHSHMICEEPFYRAGGLANVYPILVSSMMLHESASRSSQYERMEGYGNITIAESGLGEGDTLFLISNSGRNTVIIDAALEGKKRGATTIALTSLNHSNAVTSRHSSGKKLKDVCDIVIDNGGFVGDASVQLEGLDQKIGPTSSVIDTVVINLIVINTVENLLKKGLTPPIFTSANLDLGDAANAEILREYRTRIRIL